MLGFEHAIPHFWVNGVTTKLDSFFIFCRANRSIAIWIKLFEYDLVLITGLYFFSLNSLWNEYVYIYTFNL